MANGVPLPIGEALFSANPTVRTASLTISGLKPGPHQIFVIGQDFAGQWQDIAAPTSAAWMTCRQPFATSGRDPLADEDDDGATDFAEYAFGTDWSAADVSAVGQALLPNGRRNWF